VLIEPTAKFLPFFVAGGWLLLYDPENRVSSSAGLLVVLGSRFDPGRILSAPAAWLGRTSYAIYILHVPVAYWVLLACHRALGPAPHIWLVAPITLAAVAAAATLADLVWDVPIRKALSRRLMAILRRRPPSAAPA